MAHLRAFARLALLGIGVAISLGACVLEHRPDGGITIRPIHIG